MKDSSVQLPDGLSIRYTCYGDPEGKPAFYFHGLPGSCYEAEFLDHACQQTAIRLIAPDRFGYGQTSPVRHHRYLRWADCVRALANRFEFDKFYLFAHSGGCPYALACASILQERVIATGICGGLGPLVIPELRASMQTFSRLALLLARYTPWLLSLSYGLGATIAARHFSSAAIAFLGLINGEPDKTTLARTEVRQLLSRNLQNAFTQGARGGIDDLIAATQTWPFRLVNIGPLYLWAGDKDRVVPLSHSQWIQRQVPHAKLVLVAGEGHFSLPFGYATDIVKTVITASHAS